MAGLGVRPFKNFEKFFDEWRFWEKNHKVTKTQRKEERGNGNRRWMRMGETKNGQDWEERDSVGGSCEGRPGSRASRLAWSSCGDVRWGVGVEEQELRMGGDECGWGG